MMTHINLNLYDIHPPLPTFIIGDDDDFVSLIDSSQCYPMGITIYGR